MNDHTTYDDIVKAAKELGLPKRENDLFGFKHPRQIFGMNVVEAPKTPVLQLSESVDVTDEFRKQFNQWALDLFGYKSIIPDGVAYMIGGYDTVVMSPNSVAMLELSGV